MSVLTYHGRQWELFAHIDVTAANAIAGNTYTVTLPPNAMLMEMYSYTTTAFDSATSATLTVGDGTTTFISAVDLKTTGTETVTGIGKLYPNGATLTVSTALVGTTTVGENVTLIGYVVLGRVNEVQSQ